MGGIFGADGDILLPNKACNYLEENYSFGEHIKKTDDYLKTCEQKDEMDGSCAQVHRSPLSIRAAEIECEDNSSSGEEYVGTEDEDGDTDNNDEEIAEQLAKAMKVHLPEVLNRQHPSQVKHVEDFGITFKIKGSSVVADTVLETPQRKCLSKTSEENISWAPKIQFTSSTAQSKCDMGKAITQPGRQLNKHSIEATAWKNERQLQDGLLVPPIDPKKLKKLARKQVKDTLGAKWFDMPAQTITPELKKDLQLLKLRNVVDPKRHYKTDDGKGLPKYFQVGTVIEPAAEFYSGRLTKKERKPTIADELLSDSAFQQYRKRKHLEIERVNNPVGKRWSRQKKNHHKRRT